jgi:DNA-binding transcriptional LysR family regulator
MTSVSAMSLSHLKFRHLMLIVLLSDQGTLHKAAQVLNVSQPAVTGMLNDLERLLGLVLFDRGRQGVVPTAATRSIIDRCRLMLNEFDDLVAAINRVSAGEPASLRVGIVPQAFVAFFPQTVERFRHRGGCALRAREGTARQLLDALLKGELDCVVGRLPGGGSSEDPGIAALRFVKLYEEDICIVAGADHPLTAVKRPTFDTLAACDWVLQRPDSSVRGALAEAFLRQGLRLPAPVVESSTYIQSLSLVANSRLLTVAPRRAAERQAALGLVRIVDIQLNVSPMQVGLITRQSAAQLPAVALFHTCFIESVGAAEIENAR